MSYAGISKITPRYPLPPPPPCGKDRFWVCLYCKTKTNIFTYRANGSKPCYNCGSTEGEVK